VPRLALALYALYFALAFGWRTWLQLRRTGSSGFVGISRAGVLERLGGALLIVSLVLGVVSPLAELSGSVAYLVPARLAPGAALYAVGLALTFAAQLQMGVSWRIGVDPSEKTGLVTAGPFALARNPIFSGMIAVALGLLLLVPNVFALLAVAALVTGVEIQVRLVEEPYLVKQHGDAYLSWARRTGRFVPGLGRLP
jgi:protein-S-isoprenylcysteine O-methyltransferase Ste14